MKHAILVLFLVTSGFLAIAQQEIQYTNFMFSQMAFNPAFAGSNDAICGTILNRQQWMGYESSVDQESGAPKTFYLTLHTALNQINSGIGLSIISDQIGFENNKIIRLAYAYKLNVGPGKLSLGIQPGFYNKTIDFSKFRATDPNDPTLQGAEESSMTFDMAFGAYYKIPGKLYAGFSSTQMQGFWGAKAEFASANKDIGNPEYVPNYIISGGYYYQLPDMPEITINPNILVKTDFGSAQFDINVLGWYNNQIWAGVTYRAVDAVAILAGYKVVGMGALDGLMGGVSYDITTSALGAGGRSSGSFEVFVNYCFNIVFPPTYQGHGTVRFL